MKSASTMTWPEIGGGVFFLLLSLALALAGCERERKVLDIETPGFEMEIHEREGRDNKEFDIEIDTPE